MKLQTHRTYKILDTTTITISGHPKAIYIVAVGGKVKTSTCKSYPFRKIMDQNRLLKLEETKGLCEECSNPAVEVHHRDGKKFNHNVNNLKSLCVSCHRKHHILKGRKHRSYTRKNIPRTYSQIVRL